MLYPGRFFYIESVYYLPVGQKVPNRQVRGGIGQEPLAKFLCPRSIERNICPWRGLTNVPVFLTS